MNKPVENIDVLAGEPVITFVDDGERYNGHGTNTREKLTTAVAVYNSVLRNLEEMNVHDGDPIEIFDAGIGEASNFRSAIKAIHKVTPHSPVLAAAREFSAQHAVSTLEKLVYLFAANYPTVVSLTNMAFTAAPSLKAPDKSLKEFVYQHVPLTGGAEEIKGQILELRKFFDDHWGLNDRGFNAKNVVILLYHENMRAALQPVIPSQKDGVRGYHEIIAAQSVKLGQPIQEMVGNQFFPLAKSLRPGGELLVTQASPDNLGAEIIKSLWPGQDFYHADTLNPVNLFTAAQRALAQHSSGTRQLELHIHEDLAYGLKPKLVRQHAGTEGRGEALAHAAYAAATYAGQVSVCSHNERLQNFGEVEAVVDRVLSRDLRQPFLSNRFFSFRRPTGSPAEPTKVAPGFC